MISDAVNNPIPLPKLHIEHTPFSTVLHEFCGVSFDHRRHHGSAGGHILVVHPHGTIQHNDPGEKNSGRVANLTKDGWIKPSFVDGWRTKNDKLLWSYWWRVTTSEIENFPRRICIPPNLWSQQEWYSILLATHPKLPWIISKQPSCSSAAENRSEQLQ